MTAKSPKTKIPDSDRSRVPSVALSEKSENSSVLNFTPSATPPYTHEPYIHTSGDSHSSGMAESNAASSTLREEVQPTKVESPAVQSETKAQDAPDTKVKKVACKKHGKAAKKNKKKSKAKEDSSGSSSDTSSFSDSSSDEEDSTDSRSSSSEEEDSEEERKQRRKQKAKKARKLKEKKKARSRKRKESSEEDSGSDSEDESSSDEDEKRRKLKSKKRRRSKRQAEDDDDEEIDLDDVTERAQAQLKALGLRNRHGSGRRNRAREDLIKQQLKLNSKSSKGKKKKQKRFVSLGCFFRSTGLRNIFRASKVDFVRVDQLWDSSIHNYKLTETAEDADADEYDQYVFTVRRKFDWENKYTDTVVDIKSKPLREALTHVMGAVKGVSFAEDTPVVDPNMLFLYLEEMRAHMKELKGKSKSEKKKKARKNAGTKASHVKVMVKYLDKDYADTKKTLYPLLETNTITFDLLWALFKSNEIAYCPTYSNLDEPRAFKIEYATKVCEIASVG